MKFSEYIKTEITKLEQLKFYHKKDQKINGYKISYLKLLSERLENIDDCQYLVDRTSDYIFNHLKIIDIANRRANSEEDEGFYSKYDNELRYLPKRYMEDEVIYGGVHEMNACVRTYTLAFTFEPTEDKLTKILAKLLLKKIFSYNLSQGKITKETYQRYQIEKIQLENYTLLVIYDRKYVTKRDIKVFNKFRARESDSCYHTIHEGMNTIFELFDRDYYFGSHFDSYEMNDKDRFFLDFDPDVRYLDTDKLVDTMLKGLEKINQPMPIEIVDMVRSYMKL